MRHTQSFKKYDDLLVAIRQTDMDISQADLNSITNYPAIVLFSGTILFTSAQDFRRFHANFGHLCTKPVWRWRCERALQLQPRRGWGGDTIEREANRSQMSPTEFKAWDDADWTVRAAANK